MTINDFIDEYDNLTHSRKADFLHNLISSLVFKDTEEKESGEELIARTILGDLLEACVMEEQEDYFGTEGFDG